MEPFVTFKSKEVRLDPNILKFMNQTYVIETENTF